MQISGGVLTIGSLFWRRENPIRDEWHRTQLETKKSLNVWVPIRYGRLSRSQTFTMVFSNACYDAECGLGVGLALPFQLKVGFEEIENQAIWLAQAERERKTPKTITAGWFTVAMLINPDSKFYPVLNERWPAIIGSNLKDHELTSRRKLASETPCIDERGLLQIRWPKQVDETAGALPWDFLLATATVPEPWNEPYPDPSLLAEKWSNARDPEYFVRNVQSGIRTFQDRQIVEQFSQLRFPLPNEIASLTRG